MNMDLQKQGQLLDGRIKSIQIISFALLLGATFTVIIFCAIADWQAVHQNFNLLSIIGLAMERSRSSLRFSFHRCLARMKLMPHRRQVRTFSQKNLRVHF